MSVVSLKVDKHDLEGWDEFVTPELAQKWREQAAGGLRRFPGHRIEITDMMAGGDKVWIRVATSGGYAGGWLGIPATD